MARGGNKLTKLKSALKKWNSFSKTDDQYSSRELHAVYVGKSRRRYLVSSEVVGHPVFRELAERYGDSDTICVGCEVVMFDHLLWMLQNADTHPDSLNDLAHFYSSCL